MAYRLKNACALDVAQDVFDKQNKNSMIKKCPRNSNSVHGHPLRGQPCTLKFQRSDVAHNGSDLFALIRESAAFKTSAKSMLCYKPRQHGQRESVSFNQSETSSVDISLAGGLRQIGRKSESITLGIFKESPKGKGLIHKGETKWIMKIK